MIMTLNTLNENFKGLIDEIITCDVFELETFSFQHNDIIITTIPIMTCVCAPVVFIQGKVEYYYHEILSLLKSEYDINNSIREYLPECLYRESVACKTKQDVFMTLKEMLETIGSEEQAKQLIKGIYRLGNEVEMILCACILATMPNDRL